MYLAGGRNAEAWLGEGGLLSQERVVVENSLLSHCLSLRVDGSEDYKIPVQWLAIDFVKRDGQITIPVEGRNQHHGISLVASKFLQHVYFFLFKKKKICGMITGIIHDKHFLRIEPVQSGKSPWQIKIQSKTKTKYITLSVE